MSASYDHLYYDLKATQIPGRCTLCREELPKRRRVWCSDECRDKAEELRWKYISHRHLQRTGMHCETCGTRDFYAVVHHKIPITEDSGTSRDENLIVLCPRCHGSAHMRLQTHKKSARRSAFWKKHWMAEGNSKLEDFMEI